jgi:hypothetical protein
MAQPIPNNQPQVPLQRPTPKPTPVVVTAHPGSKAGSRTFLFDKSNYRLMLIGFGLILLGLFLMAGGKSPDPNVFNDAEVYSFRRITLAPVLMMIGFGIEMWAILKKPKTHVEVA